jgi:aldehyde dehydrogenase (NAD+)
MAEVVAAAREAAESTKVDANSADGEARGSIGPVVSRTQFEKVQRLIESGIAEGATLVTGGVGRPGGVSKGYFVKPTVFAGVRNDMTIAREEIFGPVLSIIDFAGCFGGYKQSGNGREWGEAGLEEFLELKAIFGYEAGKK